MRIAAALVLLFSINPSGLGIAADAPPPATTSAAPPEIDALITQLGAEDWRLRDAAHTLIVAMGEAAVDRMRDVAARSTNAEVEQRAHEILREIAAASVTGPSRVTLHFKSAPARKVYESLFAQAKAKLITWPNDLFEDEEIAPVTVDLDKVPFWEAMEKLQAQTGLTVVDHGRQITLSSAEFARPKGEVFISGPYRVVAEDFGGGIVHRLTVFVEPRIRVLGYARDAEIDEAADARGRLVAQGAPIQTHMMPGGNAFDVHLNAHGPVERLRGTIRAVVSTREQKVEIDDIANANNVERKVDGRRFMLNAMNPEPGDWVITLIAYNTDPPTPGLQQLETTLLDADGNELSLGGHSSGGAERRVAFQMNFRQDAACGPPEKMILRFPLETQEIRIPFDFAPRGDRRQAPLR